MKSMKKVFAISLVASMLPAHSSEQTASPADKAVKANTQLTAPDVTSRTASFKTLSSVEGDWKKYFELELETQKRGNYVYAAEFGKRAIALAQQQGTMNLNLADCLTRLADLESTYSGRPKDAITNYRKALAMYKALLKRNDPRIKYAELCLGALTRPRPKAGYDPVFVE